MIIGRQRRRSGNNENDRREKYHRKQSQYGFNDVSRHDFHIYVLGFARNCAAEFLGICLIGPSIFNNGAVKKN